MKRLFAIGDIHGESTLLHRLLNRLNLTAEDQLVFMGDMIDRGPDSKGVVETVRWYVRHRHAIALLGNHELFPLTPEMRDVWMYPGNGGQDTLASYGGDVPGDVLDWFKTLPVELVIDGIYFCHAPYSKDVVWNKVWYNCELQREPKIKSPEKFAICGHIHRLKEGMTSPRIYRNYAFIDTGAGCAPWGPLTAFEVYTKQIIQEWPA